MVSTAERLVILHEVADDLLVRAYEHRRELQLVEDPEAAFFTSGVPSIGRAHPEAACPRDGRSASYARAQPCTLLLLSHQPLASARCTGSCASCSLFLSLSLCIHRSSRRTHACARRYTVVLQVGTPPQEVHLILDTGSSALVLDVGWRSGSSSVILGTLLLCLMSVRLPAPPLPPFLLFHSLDAPWSGHPLFSAEPCCAAP